MLWIADLGEQRLRALQPVGAGSAGPGEEVGERVAVGALAGDGAQLGT
jgi:hypothetical protein